MKSDAGVIQARDCETIGLVLGWCLCIFIIR
jgi:hypothetical protein